MTCRYSPSGKKVLIDRISTRAKYFWMKERWIFKADGCMRRSNQSKHGRLNYKI